MSTEQDITHNIQAINPNLEKLKQAFPHCFDKNGDFDFAKFKAELDSNDINIAKEGYSLDWLGKSYARVLASDAATTLLKEDEVHNAKPENANSQNLLIKGDNLEVLKHLSNAYYEKVKMIYIDPPYNTGSDGFVYNDDRKFTAKQLQDLAGVSEDEAKRILEFTQSNSNSHSAWLTFMYPRLYIAKQLLKDDGVIFVSIDDNEVAQLRLLMDEVFGEENFVSNFIWKKKGTTSNVDGADVSSLFDNTICYKNFKGKINPRITLKETRKYPNQDELGIYRTTVIEKKNEGSYERATMEFEILGHKPRLGKRWQIGMDKAQELIGKDRLYFDGEKIMMKIYDFEDIDTTSAQPNILDMHGSSDSANKMVKGLFDGIQLFDTPKPIELINYFIKISSNKNDIILDFFAGSGTTAHAVMQLNAEDGGNRQFILVQLPELIDLKKNKTAYDFVKDELGVTPPTIFEITKERIIRAANQINAEIDNKIDRLKNELPTEENKAEIAKYLALKTQNAFKIFETTPIWEDYDFKAEKLANAEKLFDDDKLTEADIKALFTTWKTYDGSPLTEPVQEVGLAGYKAYYTKQKLYLMHKGFSTVTLKALLEQIDADANFNPTAIIAFGYYFESKALREIAENIKTYNNKKNIDIDFITRY